MKRCKSKPSRIVATLFLVVTVLCWGVASTFAAAPYPYPHNNIPAGAMGFNPAVNYDVPNFNVSPNLRKFVDTLPGLGAPGCTPGLATDVPPYSSGTCNQNNLGQYIPVAVPTTFLDGADYYEIAARNYSIKLHSDLPATTLRGYTQTNAAGGIGAQNVSQYLGPAIIARVYDPTRPAGQVDPVKGDNGRPVRMLFSNQLPLSNSAATGKPNDFGMLGLPVDTTIMGAGFGPMTAAGAACDMGTVGANCATYTQNRVTIPHLHGGRTPWISDGTTYQWLTPAGEPSPLKTGPSLVNVPDMPAPPAGSATSYFTNQQSARLMFWHDHVIGITRLNVYAGVAAPYLLVDQVEEDLIDGSNKSGGNPGLKKILPNLGGIYRYGIPLVIQDKSFVHDGTINAAAVAATAGPNAPYAPVPPTSERDPLWFNALHTWGNAAYTPPGNGSLWLPHEYMPVENIYDGLGTDPNPVTNPLGIVWVPGNLSNGRWDYAPFMIPPLLPMNLTLPSPTIIPEAFGDTNLVNGTAFPYVELPPTAVRFRILAAGNDRVYNLSLFQATTPTGTVCVAPGGSAVAPGTCTEVKMVPAAPNAAFLTWPKDGRDGGVPDPLTKGPDWIQVGNEGGLLAQAAIIPANPENFDYIRQDIPFAGVSNHSLLLLPAHRADVLVDLSGYHDGDVLMLYNDAGAPMPFFWPNNDYFTDNPDLQAIGGPPTTPPGFGPNIRTVMQIRIKTPPGFVTGSINVADVQTAIPKAFAVSNDMPIVPQLAHVDAINAYNVLHPATPMTVPTADNYIQAPDTTLNVSGVGQPIAKIKPIMPGNNYTIVPVVTIIGDGTGAAATAGLNPMGAVTLGATGTGYTTATTVTFGAPACAPLSTPAAPNPACVQATGIVTVSGGQVQAINIDEDGAGYTAAIPTCTIAGVGTGATCSVLAATANTVGSITVTNPGAGYTREPRVYITPAPGNNGLGASAVALLKGAAIMTGKNITEGADPEYGRLDIRLGSTPNPLTPAVGAGFVLGISRYLDPPTEILNDGENTFWRIGHLGVDSHALHFHLFDVQVVNRVDWTNVVKPPYPDELGWRDTIRTNPMEDIIVAFRPRSVPLPFAVPTSSRLLDPSTPAGSVTNFYPVAPPAGVAAVAQQTNVLTNFGWEYVWHCHMLGHEENDFMRPIVFMVVPPVAPVLAAPVLGVAAGHLTVTLNWTETTAKVSGFTVQRALANTTAGWAAATSFPAVAGTVLTLTDNTVGFSIRYYYRVTATNNAGNSVPSNVVNLLTPATLPPTAPAVLLMVRIPGATSASAVWTLTAGATGFFVQRATNAAFTTGVVTTAINGGASQGANISGLTGATTYYWRVATRTAAFNTITSVVNWTVFAGNPM